MPILAANIDPNSETAHLTRYVVIESRDIFDAIPVFLNSVSLNAGKPTGKR